MCILFIAVEQHPDYPLIIAANRDEFYSRPTMHSHFWHDYPSILAGKDLRAGGTWMGVNNSGYISALTNFRDPQNILTDAPSRGELVSNYLKTPSDNYADYLQTNGHLFNGFNLLFGHWQNLKVFSNTDFKFHALNKGCYGLSNATLNTPWPKLTAGVEALKKYTTEPDDIATEQLFSLLYNQTKAQTEQLPNTGISVEMETQLSSIFINIEDYGTRCSTLLLINKDQQLEWHERIFDENAQPIEEHNYHINLKN